jgi:hypothetical protein
VQKDSLPKGSLEGDLETEMRAYLSKEIIGQIQDKDTFCQQIIHSLSMGGIF